jgi:hypothetical protein
MLVNRTDKKYVLDLLTNEFREILEELSEYNASDFYSDDYIDIDEDDPDDEMTFDNIEDDADEEG